MSKIKTILNIIVAFISVALMLSIAATPAQAANVKSVIGGTGIETHGIEDVTVSILESFRLPQGCQIGQVSSFDGIKWICADDGIKLPFEAIGAWDWSGISLFNTGTGGSAGNFSIDNPANTHNALQASTNGEGSAFNAYSNGKGYAISANAEGENQLTFSAINSGMGMVAAFESANPENPNPALQIKAGHDGDALQSYVWGMGSAGSLWINNPANNSPALNVSTNGGGNAIRALTEGTGWAGYFSATTGRGLYVSVPAINPGLSVVGGTKSTVVQTTQKPSQLYTEESTEVWFTDYGFGQLTDGFATVTIEPLFAQTVNLNEPYHVFVQAYGNTGLYVTNRTSIGFEVHATDTSSNAEFSYRIVAKRLRFEDVRLEEAGWAENDPNL